MEAATETLVIGLGNSARGDDALGPVAIERLRPRLPEHVRSLCHGGEAVSLMEAWGQADHVIVIDAVCSRCTLYRRSWSTKPGKQASS